jgi:hypothetical protein
MPREPWFVLFLYEKYAPASGPGRVHRRRCGRHSEIRAQAFSAVLGQVVSMRDRERARDGSVNVLSLRTLRVFSDHKQETDSSTKGLVCLPRNQVKDSLRHHGLWTLEYLFRGNGIIHRAHKAIQGDDCRPRRTMRVKKLAA